MKLSNDNINRFCSLGKEVIRIEAEAVAALQPRIDEVFAQACQYLLQCEGRIIVSGMGKSGHIGNKIAATLASTGSPAFFVHPGEASHGDLGMITNRDVILAISYSGEANEIICILPIIKRLGIPLISMTGNPESTIARTSTVNLNIQVEREACPLGLAPTSSTSAALAMGDALAIALLQVRGFTAEDFAKYHPGGALGKKLLFRVADMLDNTHKPAVSPDSNIKNVIVEISEKRLGVTAVIENDKVIGIITDGDIRRMLNKTETISGLTAKDIMTVNPKMIQSSELVSDALNTLEHYAITQLVVLDKDEYQGVLHLHDILKEGIV